MDQLHPQDKEVKKTGYSFGDKVRRISRPGDPADRSEAE
jgi:hypothetical protein